jgi:hypothetical protein
MLAAPSTRRRLSARAVLLAVPGEGCGVVRTYFTARSAGTAVITAGRTTCGEALACVGSHGRFKLTVQVG